MNTKFQRKLKDIPELVERLREEKARQKDYLLPQAGIEMQAGVEQVDGKDKGVVTLKVGTDTLKVMDQAHGQVAGKLEIPGKYYNRMLAGDPRDQGLLAENVNHWLLKGENKKKKRFVRAIDGTVRAFLGSRYRPVSHLDLVTQAVQVVMGMEDGDQKKPWAKGARCFAWAMDPMRLDVEFVNPCISVDMDHLDQGYSVHEPTVDKDNGGGGTQFTYAGGVKESSNPAQGGWFHKPGTHLVFPSVRIQNSETGHGGLTVTAGLYEAICDNTSHIGFSLAQIHVGRELTEAELWSPETHQRINATIFSKTRDVMRSCFNPDELLKWCKRFKGLEEIQVHDVSKATEHIIGLTDMSEGLRDDILAAYYATTSQRGNLYDLQRAVTGAAHTFRETDAKTAAGLEDLGGLIIEQGVKVLA